MLLRTEALSITLRINNEHYFISMKAFMTWQDSDHKNLFDVVQKMLDFVANKHRSYRAALFFLLSIERQKEGTGSCS